MPEKLLEAGKIVNTHGVRGEVRIQPWCDSAEFLLGFKTIYINDSPVRVLSARAHKEMVIARLEGVDDMDAAIALKNRVIKIDAASVKLEEGQYFISDLIGLEVYDETSGRIVGHIADVLQLPANDVYVLDTEPEVLVPVVDEFVRDVDIEAGRVTVRLIEGM